MWTNDLKKDTNFRKKQAELISPNTSATTNFCFLLYISIPQENKTTYTTKNYFPSILFSFSKNKFTFGLLPCNTCQNSAQSEFL